MKFSYTVFSADSAQNLLDLLQKTLEKIDSQPQKTWEEIQQKTDTPLVHQHRIGFALSSLEQAKEFMTQAHSELTKKQGEEFWELRKGIFYRQKGISNSDKVAVLFPGQGSQYVNMGAGLQEYEPEFANALKNLDSMIEKDDRDKLSSILFPTATDDKEQKSLQELQLTQTENAQPAIGVLSMGLFHLLKAYGVKADAFAGHSFGELTALWAGGYLNDESYLFLAKERGRVMASKKEANFDAGTMIAVKGDVDLVAKIVNDLPDVQIANLNSSSQVVVAGGTQAIEHAKDKLKEQKLKVIPLPVSAAFHTNLVAFAQEPFAKSIQSVNLQTPHTPVFSNTTGSEYPQTNADELLQKQMVNSVLFKTEIENMYQQGIRIFIECGPKNVLCGLVSDILKGQDHETIPLNLNAKQEAWFQFNQGLAKLAVLGVKNFEGEKQ